jgi:hypothetical protein
MEGVYLIHTRECISIEKCVYKFGRSFTVSNRVKQYPQNSNVEFIMSCNNSVKCEKEILKLLRAKFKQASLYGSEYFEGDKHLMIEIIFNYINGKYNIVKPNVIEPVIENVIENVIEPVIKLVIEPVIEPVNNIIKIENKTVNICPNINCNKEFMYISELKRHLTKSYHCGKDIIDIDLYIIQKKDLKKTEDKKCNYCNTTYSKKSCLDRHIKKSKCTIKFKESQKQKQLEDLKNEIDKLKLQINIQNKKK